MFEGPPNPESAEVSKSEVIDSLKQNPEDLSVLTKFLDRREAEVTNSREALALNVEVAEIYRDSGLLEAPRRLLFRLRNRPGRNEMMLYMRSLFLKLTKYSSNIIH